MLFLIIVLSVKGENGTKCLFKDFIVKGVVNGIQVTSVKIVGISIIHWNKCY